MVLSPVLGSGHTGSGSVSNSLSGCFAPSQILIETELSSVFVCTDGRADVPESPHDHQEHEWASVVGRAHLKRERPKTGILIPAGREVGHVPEQMNGSPGGDMLIPA